MVNLEMDHLGKFIKQELESVAQVARVKFGKVTGIDKEGDSNQVLTETDLEIGRLLQESIFKVFPKHNLIDEESGAIDNGSEFTWVIDPIDGTSNFANGVPTYGIMIGLLKENRLFAGGIALPQFSEIIVAVKDEGAFLNGKKVQVTPEKNLSKLLIAYGLDGHPENPDLTQKEGTIISEIALKARNIRTSNSVFDLVMVAKGSYGAFLNKTSKIWDNVAQEVIIQESGGTYTDFNGQSLDYLNPLSKINDNFTFIAGAPQIHNQLLDIIKKLG